MFYLKMYLMSQVVAIILRAVFLLYNYASFSNLTFSDMYSGFSKGLVYDSLVIASALLVSFILEKIVSYIPKLTSLSKLIPHILIIFLGLFYLTLASDIVFSQHLKTRIDYNLIIDNLDQATPILLTLIPEWSTWLIVILIMVTLTYYYKKSILLLNGEQGSPSSIKKDLITFLTLAVLSCLYFPEPLWRSPSLASSSAEVTNLSKNGFYNMAVDVYAQQSRDLSSQFKYIDTKNIIEKYKQVFASKKNYISKNSLNYNSTSENPEITPNIVFILMEYMSANSMKSLSPDRPTHTPFLDSLKDKSMFLRMSMQAKLAHIMVLFRLYLLFHLFSETL